MVNSTAYLSENSHVNDSKCLGEATNGSLGYRGTFLWDPRMQAWLFTATYITILPTILSSGYLADRYGPKYVCLFALLLFVFSTITAPELAKWHYGALMTDRSLIGMAE
uniref:Major facilitator superfamily (MFS) profile domain-containing protein n=1 Tax=Acrobeloides nanus TaxID=290746 RepID=A0A914CIR3_9BILA